jgi:hypothetical protein
MISSYRADSTFEVRPDRSDLTLETALAATPFGYLGNPQFFSGFLSRPEITAAALLTVADVASARYFDLAAVRARSLDPVVTASGDQLRFESFSACNGVHARLDILSSGIDSGEVSFGTTNVDINQPLRTALAKLGRDQLVHLAVGADALSMSTIDDHHVERQVEMPDRWIRGFAETPGIAQRMTLRGTLPGNAIGPFLSELPKGAPGPSYHFAATPAGLRRSVRPMTDSVHLAGTARLSAATRVARYATSLNVYGNDDGASGWVFELPGARLTLLLSPEPYRGFSGEGGLLDDLARSPSAAAATQLSELLAWETIVNPAALAEQSGLTLHDVRGGLSHLAASGTIGFDLTEQAWFHRELPIDPDRVIRDNPRLVAARMLVESRAIAKTGDTWVVATGDHHHYVDRLHDGFRCSCLWWAKYVGRRGACKHILAVTISEGLTASLE